MLLEQEGVKWSLYSTQEVNESSLQHWHRG